MKSKQERLEEISRQQWDVMYQIRDLEQMGGLCFTPEMDASGKSVREFLEPLRAKEAELLKLKYQIEMEGKQINMFKYSYDEDA